MVGEVDWVVVRVVDDNDDEVVGGVFVSVARRAPKSPL